MVLVAPVGHRRNFWGCVALTAITYLFTFSVYGFVWNWMVHSEVYRQFELKQEGRDRAILWYVLGIFPFAPLFWVYQATFVSNIDHVRRRCGAPDRFRPAHFLAFVITGSVVKSIGLVLLLVGVLVVEGTLGVALGWSGAAVTVAGFVLQAIGYYRLQTTVNMLWDWHARRVYDLSVAAARPWGPANPPQLAGPPVPRA